MPRGIHNGRRGRKPLPEPERIARRAAALQRARSKQLQKEKAATAAKRRRIAELRARYSPDAFTLSPRLAFMAGLSVVRKIRAATLTFIDSHGRVGYEDHRSAAQLIADWKKFGDRALTTWPRRRRGAICPRKKGSHNIALAGSPTPPNSNSPRPPRSTFSPTRTPPPTTWS